ncbi:hypothetical protein V6N13_074876 [Hibiscus sabdariffa]
MFARALKDQLWKDARATYFTQFQSAMDELKLILEARDKPIITLIESIRTKLMQRLAKRKDQAENCAGLLCPKIQKKLDNATSLAHRFHVVLQANIQLTFKSGHAHAENGN